MLGQIVVMCMVICVSGNKIIKEIPSLVYNGESDERWTEFDIPISTMNSAIVEHVREILDELATHFDFHEVSQKSGYEESKMFCFGGVTKKYRACKEKCKKKSMFQRMYCKLKNFKKYLKACFSDTMECYDDTGFFSRILKDAANAVLSDLAKKFDPINIPSLQVPIDELQDIMALTLEDISINGLSSLKVDNIDTGFPSLEPKINVSVPQFSIDVDHYSIKGNVLNVPFNQEGSLKLEFIKLDGCVGFKLLSLLRPCAVEGSAHVVLGDKVEFKRMDPGTEMYGADILDGIKNQLNSGPIQVAVDKVIMNAMNAALGLAGMDCPHEKLDENLN